MISKRKALKAVSFDTEAYTAINMLPDCGIMCEQGD